MKKKTIVRIFAAFAGIVIVLFTILSVHLYGIAKGKNENPNNKIQLSRIDFKQKVDSADAFKIKNYVLSLPNIQGAHFNVDHGTLVYGYVQGTVDPQEIYKKTMDFSENKFRAERFIVTADQLKQGCPAGMDISAGMVYANFLYKTFN